MVEKVENNSQQELITLFKTSNRNNDYAKIRELTAQEGFDVNSTIEVKEGFSTSQLSLINYCIAYCFRLETIKILLGNKKLIFKHCKINTGAYRANLINVYEKLLQEIANLDDVEALKLFRRKPLTSISMSI